MYAANLVAAICNVSLRRTLNVFMNGFDVFLPLVRFHLMVLDEDAPHKQSAEYLILIQKLNACTMYVYAIREQSLTF